MKLPVFVESRFCLGRRFCGVCRDRDGGRAWRESIGKTFELPADAPDFECPHGRAWQSGDVERDPWQLPGMFEVKAACEACPKLTHLIADGRIECKLRQAQNRDGCACVRPLAGDACPAGKWTRISLKQLTPEPSSK